MTAVRQFAKFKRFYGHRAESIETESLLFIFISLTTSKGEKAEGIRPSSTHNSAVIGVANHFYLRLTLN